MTWETGNSLQITINFFQAWKLIFFSSKGLKLTFEKYLDVFDKKHIIILRTFW